MAREGTIVIGRDRKVAELETCDYHVDNIYEWAEYLPDKDEGDENGVVWHYEIRRWHYGSYTVMRKWTAPVQLVFDDEAVAV